MARTLLIGSPRTSWREWIRDNRMGQAWLCLDPADPAQLTPGILNLFDESKPLATRFYGSLDAQRHPHLLLSFLAQALALAGDDLLVQTFAYRPTPVLRQTIQIVAQLLNPDRILISEGCEIDQSGFPIGPEVVSLEPALPAMVQHAQRKAQWLKLLEESESHSVDLRKITLEGARFGSGKWMSTDDRKRAGLGSSLHAEVCGGSLFAVTDAELTESDVASALDYTGCNKAIVVEPGIFRNLFCSFANQEGVDFGFGFVREVDWQSMRAKISSTAIVPAPVRILRLGSLRVDPDGRELGELRPWQV